MKFLILNGTIGQESSTRTLLKYLEHLLEESGSEVIWWDLAERPLPIALPEYHNRPDKNPHKAVRDFVAAVKTADGFIFGSPLYHDSYSGVLKNALDNLPGDALLYKPVGLISHSSNERNCVTPCMQLRPIVRSLGGYGTQAQIGTTDRDYKRQNSELKLTSQKVKNRAKTLIEELIFLAEAFHDSHYREFIDKSSLPSYTA